MFAARLLGIPEHSVRVITRDVGGGFGQKVVPLREDICVLLAARKLPAAVKWIEDRRENLQCRRAGAARARHGEARLRRRGDDPRRVARPRAGRRRVPDAVAGRHRRGDRDDLPGPVPGRQGHLQPRLGVLQHPRPDRLPRTVGVRDAGPRGHPRHRGPPDGHRPGGTAPPQPAAPRRDAVTQARPACPTTTWTRWRRWSRPWRSWTTTRSARSRPPPASRAATWASASPATPSRRRPRSATTRPRARRSGSSRPARSTSTWPAARPATAWRRRRCSSPPTRSGPTSRTCTRSRATPRSRRSARAPAAAAAAR